MLVLHAFFILTGLLTLDSLLKQIDELQLEKKEFGLQRAKMKGFILQKEGDQPMLCWLYICT